MRISDWSSDVCSSDLTVVFALIGVAALLAGEFNRRGQAKRVLVAVLCVAALEGVSLELSDIATRSAAAVPVMSLAVLLCGCLGPSALLRPTPRRSTPHQSNEPSARPPPQRSPTRADECTE